MPVCLVCMPRAGRASATRTATPAIERDERAAHDVAEDEAPDAGVALLALEAPQQRQAAAVDAVAELGEHGGEHRQRAEHRDADDQDRADRHRAALGLADEEHAGERRHHGQAGDEHGVAAGRGGGLERGQLAGAAGPLLALALEVEERVVDGDGHADQHHQDLRALAGRDELARDGGEAEGREHGGQAEQHRDAGGQQRAEGQQQDDQRDRDREELRLLEVRLRACRRTSCPMTRRRTARRVDRGAAARRCATAASIGDDLVDGLRRSRRGCRSG